MIIFDFYLLIRYLSFKDLYLRKTNEMDIGRTPKMISIEISPCRCLHHKEVNVVPCFYTGATNCYPSDFCHGEVPKTHFSYSVVFMASNGWNMSIYIHGLTKIIIMVFVLIKQW